MSKGFLAFAIYDCQTRKAISIEYTNAAGNTGLIFSKKHNTWTLFQRVKGTPKQLQKIIADGGRTRTYTDIDLKTALEVFRATAGAADLGGQFY